MDYLDSMRPETEEVAPDFQYLLNVNLVYLNDTLIIRITLYFH